MVMTRPDEEALGGPDPRGLARPPASPRRRIERPRRLPGGRAVVGGLLVALAGVGTLVAWQQASGTPDRSYAVAARPLQPGEVLAADDVRLVPIDLPDGVSGGAFTDGGDVEGRVALGPVAEGELVQAGALSEPGRGAPVAQVSFALERDRALDGRLVSGDFVDVFVTHDDQGTSVVAERVQVVAVTDGGSSFTSGAELTVTLALAEGTPRGDVIQAVRSGEVTLVRSTHLGGEGSGAAPDGSSPPAPGQAPATAPSGASPGGPSGADPASPGIGPEGAPQGVDPASAGGAPAGGPGADAASPGTASPVPGAVGAAGTVGVAPGTPTGGEG